MIVNEKSSIRRFKKKLRANQTQNEFWIEIQSIPKNQLKKATNQPKNQKKHSLINHPVHGGSQKKFAFQSTVVHSYSDQFTAGP